MKCLLIVLLMAIVSPTWALDLDRHFLKTDEKGKGFLLIHGEPLSQELLLTLSPWDIMEVAQLVSGSPVMLSEMGDNDERTRNWRQRLADFAATADRRPATTQEDPFSPDLILWDPGTIQKRNDWGEWSIEIFGRTIVQSDIASLSPLEVQQAVEVLTARHYDVEFVLKHLEDFRAQLTIAPRP